MSGLGTAKCLGDESLVPTLFEQTAEIGGVWNYHEELPAGGGIMYRSLCTNTSRQTFPFSDFPLPATLPDYPVREDILQYLQEYVTHFELKWFLRLNTLVEAIEPGEDGQWQVRTCSNGKVVTEQFDAVVVCCGRENHPFLPSIPGADTFTSKILHSSAYQGSEDFAGACVIIVGVGAAALILPDLGYEGMGTSDEWIPRVLHHHSSSPDRRRKSEYPIE